MNTQPTLTKDGQETGTTGTAPSSDGLKAGLKNRHLSMIAIGGVIGAGLFVGSGSGIAAAGPAILLSYALVGAMVVFVMRMLGEMAAARPSSGSFSAYADRALGRWAGFSIGWLYWFFWVVVLAVEATAGAKILESWVPAVPQWGWALIVMVVLTLTNLGSVASYGEFEFWFAGIKVVAIGAFVVIGMLAVFGLLPGSDNPGAGFAHLTDSGGFFPMGAGAILTGVLMVVFSFMGSEIVTLAAGESEDPQKAVTKATNSVIWRIGVFYLGSIFIVLTLLPWNDKSIVEKGSYVAALDSIGIANAGQIMNVIVLTAVLSCLNSGLYTASRMAFSLGQRGDAPKAFAKVNKRGVPTAAILGSVVFGFVAVFFNYKWPDTVFAFLLLRLAGHLRDPAEDARHHPARDAGEARREDVALPVPDLGDDRHDRLRPRLHAVRRRQRPRAGRPLAAGGRAGDRRGAGPAEVREALRPAGDRARAAVTR